MDVGLGRVAPFEDWSLGPWVLRMPSGPLLRDGEPVALSSRAIDLLVTLVRHRGEVVSSDVLLAQAWSGRVVDEGNLYVQMSSLRKLLGREAIRSVYGRGYQLTMAADPMAVREPAVTPAPLATSDLPAPEPDATALFGRHDDLQALQRHLRRSRLVTVVGPAGVGKTRLALAASAGALAVVELANLADAAPVAEALARALNVELPGQRAVCEELADALHGQSGLLVLDNCEHRVPEVADLVNRLLSRTRGLRVLATSQVPLALRDEQVFRLQPLALPDLASDLAQASGNPAVALFCARVTAIDHQFALTAAQVTDVVALCRKLDGLPLAIELAAARVPVLGLTGLRERLGERLRLLRGGSRATDVRHQTLQAAIGWSHALLTADEQRVFRRLGVFAGGFTVPLAQDVLVDPQEPGNDPMAVLDAVDGLLSKSLLVPVQTARAPRLRLLDSTRAFALDRLHADGQADALHERLVRALVRLFEPTDTLHLAYSTPARVEACEADVDNLRLALDWLALQPALGDLQVELAGACAWFWPRAGLRNEGLRRCREALERVGPDTPPALEARLLWGLTAALQHRADAADCAAAERAAVLFGQSNDRQGHFLALNVLVTLRVVRGEQAAAEAALRAMEAAYDAAWPSWSMGPRTWAIGLCRANGGDVASCLVLTRDAYQMAVQARYAPGMATTKCAEAQCLSALGQVEGAVVAARQGLVDCSGVRSPVMRGRLLGDLVGYLAELGQVDEALSLARQAVDLRVRDGSLWLMLDQLALLGARRGLVLEAASTLGCAEAHNRWRNGYRELYLQRAHRLATQAVTEALDAATLRSVMRNGALMSEVDAAWQVLGAVAEPSRARA